MTLRSRIEKLERAIQTDHGDDADVGWLLRFLGTITNAPLLRRAGYPEDEAKSLGAECKLLGEQIRAGVVTANHEEIIGTMSVPLLRVLINLFDYQDRQEAAEAANASRAF